MHCLWVEDPMKKHLDQKFVFMVSVFFLSFRARADIYQWKDDHGQTHVTTTPPPKNSLSQKVTVSEQPQPRSLGRSTSHFTPESSSKGPLPFLQPASAPSVEIYSAPWCGYCKKTKEYFRSRGVAFTEYDVETNPTAAARAKSLNPGGGIPVTIVNGRTIVGYSPSRFDSALSSQ